MSDPISAYPLCWPPGRPRARWSEDSAFRVVLGRAIKDLQHEVSLLGGVQLIISSNLKLRNDGIPYAAQAQPHDRAVAVYFWRNKRQMCFACDRWSKIEDNMRAIAKTIEALRGIERWGSGSMVEQAFTGFLALPAPRAWWQVLELLDHHATRAQIMDAHRRLAMKHHPDRGGDAERMADINAARDQGLEAIR